MCVIRYFKFIYIFSDYSLFYICFYLFKIHMYFSYIFQVSKASNFTEDVFWRCADAVSNQICQDTNPKTQKTILSRSINTRLHQLFNRTSMWQGPLRNDINRFLKHNCQRVRVFREINILVKRLTLEKLIREIKKERFRENVHIHRTCTQKKENDYFPLDRNK